MDDEAQLEKPSNALKLGFDVRRLLNTKVGLAIMKGDAQGRQDGEELLRVMSIFWGNQVTKIARVVLSERHFNAKKDLPLAEDLKKLQTTIDERLKKMDYTDFTETNYMLIGSTVLAKLISYNRRRTGEVQAVRIRDYMRRVRAGQPADRDILGTLTEFEKYLIESQEFMETRGKTGRGVPLIIPHSCFRGLEVITDENARRSASISDSNTYLFGKRGDCRSIMRGYDSLRKACQLASLEAPEKITSTSMRKYMATISQVFDLKPHQLKWVVEHMGHTLEVHDIHYRQNHDNIERVQIAKILLLQDCGRIKDFAGKRIEDIQMPDLITDTQDNAIRRESEPDVTSRFAALNDSDTDDISDVCSLSENTYDTFDQPPPKRKVISKKVKWTQEEEEEIRELFKEQFDDLKRPIPAECALAIQTSKQNKGKIQFREKDVLKKKVFRMIDALRK